MATTHDDWAAADVKHSVHGFTVAAIHELEEAELDLGDDLSNLDRGLVFTKRTDWHLRRAAIFATLANAQGRT